MRTNRKTLSISIFVFFLLCLVPVTVFAEEYILGKKYYKNFPATGNKWVELYSVTEYDEKGKHKTNIRKMREYVQFITTCPYLSTSVLSTGDGTAVSIYRG